MYANKNILCIVGSFSGNYKGLHGYGQLEDFRLSNFHALGLKPKDRIFAFF